MSANDYRLARTAEELHLFRQSRLQQAEYLLEPVAIKDQDAWAISEGALSHRSRGFFHTVLAVDADTAEEKLLLYQPQGAITCLALHRRDDDVFLLLQARAEPGNCEVVQFGPTIQSTPANFLQLHGGQPARHLGLFTDCLAGRATPLMQSTQLDLEDRYFQKTKTLYFVESTELLATSHDLVWASLQAIAGVLTTDHCLNIDLRAMISIFDWDRYLDHARDVTDAPAPIPGFPRWRPPSYSLRPLEESRRFDLQDSGIACTQGSGISVKMFHTRCRGREVGEWTQPLFCTEGVGQVDLFIRRVGSPHTDHWEFLLTRVESDMLAGRFAWGTSVDVPPENTEVGSTQAVSGNLLADMQLSEEGGRFLENRVNYRIMECSTPEALPMGSEERFWVTADELRRILQGSNRATIHLRCAASLALDLLYPETFAGNTVSLSRRRPDES